MEPFWLMNRFDRFFRIEDARSEDMFGSQAQRSRPSALRCQRQTSRCFETGIESRANRRTRLVAFDATMPDAMAGRTSRFAAATLSPPSTQIGCTGPGGARAGGRLDQVHLPKFADLSCATLRYSSQSPSECRHVILPPRRVAAKIARGSCQGAVLQTDTRGPTCSSLPPRRGCDGAADPLESDHLCWGG